MIEQFPHNIWTFQRYVNGLVKGMDLFFGVVSNAIQARLTHFRLIKPTDPAPSHDRHRGGRRTCSNLQMGCHFFIKSKAESAIHVGFKYVDTSQAQDQRDPCKKGLKACLVFLAQVLYPTTVPIV